MAVKRQGSQEPGDGTAVAARNAREDAGEPSAGGGSASTGAKKRNAVALLLAAATVLFVMAFPGFFRDAVREGRGYARSLFEDGGSGAVEARTPEGAQAALSESGFAVSFERGRVLLEDLGTGERIWIEGDSVVVASEL